MFDVVGLGENSIDEIYRLPVYPQPNSPTSKLPITDRSVRPGGQVATAMAACARLGLRSRYVGAFGSDEYGQRIRRELEERGVDTALAFERDAANRHAVILVAGDGGERVVLWQRDERLAITPDDVQPEWLTGVRLLHVDGTDEAAAIAAAGIARALGLHVTSDIEQITDRTEALVAAVTVPIFAEHAAATLTGCEDPEQALRTLRKRHDGLLCVTLGRRGALLLDGHVAIHEPAPAVDVVDSTGAGDVFRAGFIYGLLRGWPSREILTFANAAAAASCTRAGAMQSAPHLEEVMRVMRAG
jgi:sugar/nucleoside kinase (ribokinase family)